MKATLVFATLVVITVMGCVDSEPGEVKKASEPNEVKNAKAILEKKLRDPASVVYGDFAIVTPNVVCLRANSKNNYGGYSGEISFLVNIKEQGVMIADGIDGQLQYGTGFGVQEQLRYGLAYFQSCYPGKKDSH